MLALDLIGGIVKVSWKYKDEWKPFLKLTNTNYKEVELVNGMHVEFEVIDKRVCTGYYNSKRKMTPCPEHREISKGSQCYECRERDIYSGYIEGRTPAKIDAEFTVYLAQAGNQVKVGVTRSRKLTRRWVEQGVDYAVKIKDGLSSKQALDIEKNLSIKHRDLSQTIRKEEKLVKKPCKLNHYLKLIGMEGEVVDLQNVVSYPDKIGRKLVRKGRFSGEINTVKGQIVSDGDLCMALTSGKKITKPSQTALDTFKK
ncbi:DUF2797 domain-containing protein [Methanonatronarchaeum sp. AMET-Sl]|uniref:DUF2797 domain-containing protein n=1 Tax=Methanonatronarchaeum sp. AMET-Sl TaxID=3037654 RepID=UPI00244E50D8|nr:DUF2797 domain-containing protein [Methanonatronarchaeum sp. AMET-Sl]WGI17552.1 DUF2797 domain-containing protein [Methanonatronarchaeum sp. AMET-Sl]